MGRLIVHKSDYQTPLHPASITRKLAQCSACPTRDTAMCSVLDDEEIGALADIVEHLELKSGETLFDEGDDARNVYTVTDGIIKTHKLMSDGRRQITGFYFPGEFVGITHGDACAYSAQASGPTKICQFERKAFEKVLEKHPQLRSRLLNDASEGLAQAHEQMLLLGRKSATERLASFLLMANEKTTRWHPELEDNISLPMTRSDIADYLGLTTETVSRTFSNFRTNGLIAAQGSKNVRILNSDGLEDLADS